MKWLLLIGLLALFPSLAQAQCNGIFQPNTVCGNNTGSPRTPFQINSSTTLTGPGTTTIGDLALWNNTSGTLLADSPPAAMTQVNDTNVTLTLGGTPASSLVKAVSLTMGWTGTLAAARLNANVVQSFTNDTNVTASISAQNATLAWTGTLAAARGGTGANNSASTGFATWNAGVLGSVGASATILPLANGGTGASTQSAAAINLFPTPIANGDIIYWNGSAWTTLPGNNSGTQVLQENSSGVPSWVTVSGTGTVTTITPGAGIVSGVTTACSQANITTSGTLSEAHCINAQTGASYAIVDGDRAKLITASNAGAQAYTIAQAGAASAFQAGWFTEIKNISTGAAGIVTITPTTSTINGVATLVLLPGQTAKIVSDGTNYQVTAGVGTVFTASLNSDVALSNTGTYFDGPSVAQGTVGTWWASGTVTMLDTAATASFQCKLWDGTTVIASSQQNSTGANALANIALSGYLAAPAANIRISCKDISATTGVIKFNSSGNSKDSTVSVHRVQ